MTPLRLVAVGLLVVGVDLNIGRVDLLLDPVGYALAVTGLSRVAAVHRGLAVARAAMVVGLVASVLTTLLRRTVTVTSGDEFLSSTSSHVHEPLVPSLVEAGALVVAVWWVCTALIAVLSTGVLVARARFLRVAVPLVHGGGLILAVGLQDADGGAGAGLLGPVAVALALVGLVLFIWFVVVLLRAARENAADDHPDVATVHP